MVKQAKNTICRWYNRGAEGAAGRLDAEFALLALQLRELFTRLDALFGLAADEAPGG
jgi:hypothetical protein